MVHLVIWYISQMYGGNRYRSIEHEVVVHYVGAVLKRSGTRGRWVTYFPPIITFTLCLSPTSLIERYRIILVCLICICNYKIVRIAFLIK